MDQFNAVEKLLSDMNEYVKANETKSKKCRAKAKAMKKAIKMVKNCMHEITEITAAQNETLVVHCSKYEPASSYGECAGMHPSNAAYDQCKVCPIFKENVMHAVTCAEEKTF